jgi:hypothetical protein
MLRVRKIGTRSVKITIINLTQEGLHGMINV